MVAALDHFAGQAATLGSQNVSRIEWMPETGQLDCIFREFDANKLTGFGEHHVADGFPLVIRQVIGCFGGVRFCRAHRVEGIDGEYETRAKGVAGTNDIAHVHGLGNLFCPYSKIPAHDVTYVR